MQTEKLRYSMRINSTTTPMMMMMMMMMMTTTRMMNMQMTLTLEVDPSAAVRIDISNHVVDVCLCEVVTKLLQNPSVYNKYKPIHWRLYGLFLFSSPAE